MFFSYKKDLHAPITNHHCPILIHLSGKKNITSMNIPYIGKVAINLYRISSKLINIPALNKLLVTALVTVALVFYGFFSVSLSSVCGIYRLGPSHHK